MIEENTPMSKFRMRIAAALLLALTAVATFASVPAMAQHGGDDPCPHKVENLPGCK
jgi:hypothetical protein